MLVSTCRLSADTSFSITSRQVTTHRHWKQRLHLHSLPTWCDCNPAFAGKDMAPVLYANKWAGALYVIAIAFFIGCHWVSLLVGVIIDNYSSLIAAMGPNVMVSSAAYLTCMLTSPLHASPNGSPLLVVAWACCSVLSLTPTGACLEPGAPATPEWTAWHAFLTMLLHSQKHLHHVSAWP